MKAVAANKFQTQSASRSTSKSHSTIGGSNSHVGASLFYKGNHLKETQAPQGFAQLAQHVSATHLQAHIMTIMAEAAHDLAADCS